MDALVQRHEVDAALDPVTESRELVALFVSRARGGEAGCFGLEHRAHLGDPREIADIDAGDEHTATRKDLDQLLLREPAERLAHRRPSDAKALDESPLVDQRTRRQLQRDDQVADRDVGALGKRGSLQCGGQHNRYITHILTTARLVFPSPNPEV